MHSPVDRLLVDNMRVMAMADHIAAVLSRPSTKIHLEELSFEIIDFNDQVLRMHLYRQDQAILAVMREQGRPADLLAAGQKKADAIEAQLLSLRRAVELGESLRAPLEQTEWVLRDFVQNEESHLLPWARDGPMAEEVKARLDAIDGPSDDMLDMEMFEDAKEAS